ncbi:hypothetical protein sS8_3855 [Methylocaldum marinum]|uniref:Uncharacterized protein n=1 Tax=Methylocaldum marinum TaxID=1432792 RepID=A0A250KVZ7_9GAMM|nr:hypothetical protein [Methylocaldum marinum]BBA35787.1 hypothetical protein sS8_3855 [Methylocaldum marinum]
MRGLKAEKYEAALIYLQRMLKEPGKAREILVTHISGATEQLALCSDLCRLNEWIERHLNDTGWKRLQNALNQRQCSANLQRMSLKKSTYAALAKLAKERGMTLNETVEHLLKLHEADGLVTNPPADSEEAEDINEEMLIWMMARSSGSDA